MTLLELQRYIWETMDAKGFHSDRTNTRDDTIVRLALIHTEVSEATQEVKRHWMKQGTPELRHTVGLELADTMIRLLDLCGCLQLDSLALVLEKMAQNKERPFRYGTPSSSPHDTAPASDSADSGK